MQIPELAVFVLGPADEEQEFADLAAHEWRLLSHQVLEGRNSVVKDSGTVSVPAWGFVNCY